MEYEGQNGSNIFCTQRNYYEKRGSLNLTEVVSFISRSVSAIESILNFIFYSRSTRCICIHDIGENSHDALLIPLIGCPGKTTGSPPPWTQAGEMRGRSLYTSCSEVSCEIVEGLH